MSNRFCIDCKHCVTHKVFMVGDIHYCGHHINRDMVDGELDGTRCEIARQATSSCGLEGKLYEPICDGSFLCPKCGATIKPDSIEERIKNKSLIPKRKFDFNKYGTICEEDK